MWNSKSGRTKISENLQENEKEYTPLEKRHKTYSEKALNEALECCKSQELGIEEASVLYGVPKRTLRTKLKSSQFSLIDEQFRVFVLPIFPTQAESDLVEHLQDLILSQVSYSSVEVRRLGYELVSEKYKVSLLPNERNCILGKRWYEGFISKNPHLDVDHPILIPYTERSKNFYNALENFVTKFEIDASRMFSVDGVELKFRASSIDDLKIFHRRKTIYTDAKAICCTSPTGCYIPPVFLEPRERCTSGTNLVNGEEFLNLEDFTNQSRLGTVCEKLKEFCDLNTKHLPSSEDLADIQKQIKIHLNKKQQPMSEESEEELREKLYEYFNQLRNKIISSYESTLNKVTHEIFHDWFLNFIKFVKPNSEKKVLLLLSDQSYIKCFKTLELAKENGVIFLVLPSHTVHKIHPLDGFAMSLNRNLSTCARRWLAKNTNSKVQHVPLHALFQKAYGETVNPMIAKNGFLYSGVWPINKNIFESTELGGESVLLQNSDRQSCTKTTAGVSGGDLSLSGITNKSDLQKLCRICMKEKMYMKPLFESSPMLVPNYYGKKISEILNIAISPDDGLPPSICQYCLVQLIDTLKIKTLTNDSHNKQLKLREALNRIYFGEVESNKRNFLSFLEFDINQPNHTKILNRLLSKTFDMDSICRICMAEKPLMTSIFFKPYDETSGFCSDVSRKITEVTQRQVHVDDGLSSFICPFCRASINQASEFVQKVTSSNRRFREIGDLLKS